jgi:hypothetical protein
VTNADSHSTVSASQGHPTEVSAEQVTKAGVPYFRADPRLPLAGFDNPHFRGHCRKSISAAGKRRDRVGFPYLSDALPAELLAPKREAGFEPATF